MKKLFLLAWLMMLSIVAMAQSIVVVDKLGKRTAYDTNEVISIDFQTTPPGFTVNMDGKAVKYTFDLVQKVQGLPDYVFAHPDTVYVDADGEEFTFNLMASTNFDVVPSAAWLTEPTALPDAEGVMAYKAGMNPSVDKRTGYLLLATKDRLLTDTVFVVQEGKDDSRYIAIDWETTTLDSFDAETGVAQITFAGDVPVMGEYDVVMLPDEQGTLMIRVIEEVTQTSGKTVTLKTTQGDMGNLFRDQNLTFELGGDEAATARGTSGSKPVFRPEKVEIFEDGKFVEVYNAHAANARGNRAPATQELTLDYEGSDIMLESWGNLTFKIKKAKLAMKFKGTLEFSFERQPWYKVWKGHTTKASVLLEGDTEGETVLDISCRTPNEMSGQPEPYSDDMMKLKTGVVQQRYTFNVEGVPVQVVLNGDVLCNHGYQCLGQGDVVGGHKYSKHFKYGLTCVDDNLDGEFIFEETPTLSLIYPEANIGNAEYKNSQCHGRAGVRPTFHINFYGQYCRTQIGSTEWTLVNPRSWLPYPDEAPDDIARHVRVDRWSNTLIHMYNIPGWLLDHSAGDNFPSDEVGKAQNLMYNPEDFTLETPERDLMQDDEQDIEVTVFHYDYTANEKLTSIGALVAFEIEGSASGDKKLLLKYTDENGKAKVTFKKGEPPVERVNIKLCKSAGDDNVAKFVEKKWTSKLLKYNIRCLNPSQEVEKGAEAVPVHFLLQKTEGTDLSAWAHKRVEFVATNGTVSPRFNTTDAEGLVTAYFTPTNDAPEGEVIAIVTEEGNKKNWEGRATGKITIKGSSKPCDTGDEQLNKADQQDNSYVITNKTTGETQTRSYDPKLSEWRKEGKDFIMFQLEDADENGRTLGDAWGNLPWNIVNVVKTLTGQSFENSPGGKFGWGVYTQECHLNTFFGAHTGESGMVSESNLKPESKILLRKPCNQTKPVNSARRAPGEEEEEYTGEYELLFYLVFENDGNEYEVYGKGTMKMHEPTITSFQVNAEDDWVKVGESTKVNLQGYYEEEATWDWDDVELVGQATNYEDARKGVDEGFFTWDAATQTLTSVKANDNKNVYVRLGLKSKPGVQSTLSVATGEGWKYTTITPSRNEVTYTGYGYMSFSFDWTPKESDDERFDFNSLEIDPETNPNGYFSIPSIYAAQGWPLYVNSDTPAGEYTVRFWIKSNHDVNCTVKVIAYPE